MSIKTLDQLVQIRNNVQTNLRHSGVQKNTEILIGMGTCGIAAGARETANRLAKELALCGLDTVHMISVGYNGQCKYEPIIEVCIPSHLPVAYGHVTKDKVQTIVKQHLMEGRPVDAMRIDTTLAK